MLKGVGFDRLGAVLVGRGEESQPKSEPVTEAMEGDFMVERVSCERPVSGVATTGSLVAHAFEEVAQASVERGWKEVWVAGAEDWFMAA